MMYRVACQSARVPAKTSARDADQDTLRKRFARVKAAMRFHATADDLIDQLFIYPTMAEALKIAALSFTRDVATLSYCAS